MTTALKNDPRQAGALATRKELLHGSRFAVAAVHTRFDAVEWFVWDAELEDDVTGSPAVIRQEATRALAVAGLVAL